MNELEKSNIHLQLVCDEIFKVLERIGLVAGVLFVAKAIPEEVFASEFLMIMSLLLSALIVLSSLSKYWMWMMNRRDMNKLEFFICFVGYALIQSGFMIFIPKAVYALSKQIM